MAFESYEKVVGIVQDIRRGDSCCNQMITVMTESGLVHVILAPETRVIDCVQIRRGMRIAAFYDGTLPMPTIFPPRYRAELITSLRRDQNVVLQYFDGNLLAEDNSLQLNVSPMTNVVTVNGQRFTCNPGEMELLVYYTATTFSIPPQTTPQKIVVMCPE